MKIKNLTVKIEPVTHATTMRELGVMVAADGKRYEFTSPFHENDFESLFSCLMDEAESEIIRMVNGEAK